MLKCPKENECKHYGADCSDGGPVEGCFEPHDITIAKETRKQIVDRWVAQRHTDLIRMTKRVPKSDLPWLRKQGQEWLDRGHRDVDIIIQIGFVTGWRTATFDADIAKEDWGRCLMAWYLIDRKKDSTKQKIKVTE